MNKKLKNSQQEKGITLIALIITIVVLLILAAVSISSFSDDNGILNPAKTSQEKMSYATVEEQIKTSAKLITEGENTGKIDLRATKNTIEQLQLDHVANIEIVENVLKVTLDNESVVELIGILPEIVEPESIISGTYEMTKQSTDYIDLRPSDARDYSYVFRDTTFINHEKTTTRSGAATTRVGEVIKLTGVTDDANIKFKFVNCTFNNCSFVFGALSGLSVNLDITFENCTFNALTKSGLIELNNYIKGNVNITNCTFNVEATTSNFEIIKVSNSSNTNLVINATNNKLNANAAIPYTYDPSKGETAADNVQLLYTPNSICLFDYRKLPGGYTQINETGTVISGNVAIESRKNS